LKRESILKLFLITLMVFTNFISISAESDITAPTADLSTLSASPKVAYVGDTVSIKVKAYDEQSGS
jgi:hypothetical protein